jgi:hypothetical protein
MALMTANLIHALAIATWIPRLLFRPNQTGRQWHCGDGARVPACKFDARLISIKDVRACRGHHYQNSRGRSP